MANAEESKSRQGVDGTLIRHGGLSYLEIPAIDPARSARFYNQVLGWNISESGGSQKFSDATGHLIGRWITCRSAPAEFGLLPYFYVNQIDQALSRVTPNGGAIAKPKFREGNLWVATVLDPTGNVIGLWEIAE